MACAHKSCQCEIQGCGLSHPAKWVPAMMISINDQKHGGDDVADCMAHYLLAAGYPRDRPDHLRRVAESMAARRDHKRPRPPGARVVTQK